MINFKIAAAIILGTVAFTGLIVSNQNKPLVAMDLGNMVSSGEKTKNWEKFYDKSNWSKYPLKFIKGEANLVDGVYVTKDHEVNHIMLPEVVEFPFEMEVDLICYRPVGIDKNKKKMKDWSWNFIGLFFKDYEVVGYKEFFYIDVKVPTQRMPNDDYKEGYIGFKLKRHMLFTKDRFYFIFNDQPLSFSTIDSPSDRVGFQINNSDVVSIKLNNVPQAKLEKILSYDNRANLRDLPEYFPH